MAKGHWIALATAMICSLALAGCERERQTQSHHWSDAEIKAHGEQLVRDRMIDPTNVAFAEETISRSAHGYPEALCGRVTGHLRSDVGNVVRGDTANTRFYVFLPMLPQGLPAFDLDIKPNDLIEPNAPPAMRERITRQLQQDTDMHAWSRMFSEGWNKHCVASAIR